jgi:hypothetical protein
MDLLDQNYVKKLIDDIESSQNRERRQEEIKAFEVYSGKLHDHVYNRIQDIYPKTYNSFSIADLNISRKVTDKRARSYKQRPIRQLATEMESESYNAMLSDMNASAAFQWFDVYYNLHRHAALWFSYIVEDDDVKLMLRPLTPFQFSRVVDLTGKTKVFIVNFPNTELYESTDTDGRKSLIQDSQQDTSCRRYAIWTDEQHVIVNVEGENEDCRIMYEEIEGNEDSVNFVGKIPAVFAQEGDSAALPILNPITGQVIEFNQQYSVMLTGASLQTFGHLVLKHPSEQPMPNEIYNSLFTYSRLPQIEGETATELDYINPNPNLESQLQVLQNFGHQIITEHLGDGAQTVNGSDNFASGLDRMIAMSDISNIIESNQQIFARVENDLYLVIRSFFEQLNDFRYKSDSLTVKYPKAKPIMSEKEVLDNIKLKLDLGLIEKYEALLMLDPNMEPEVAKEKIERIKEEKQANVSQFMGTFDNADQEE